jgi:hypothetical protein
MTLPLRPLASCTDGQTCPGAWAAPDGTVLVRGDQTSHPEVPLGDGEVLIQIPAATLLEAAAKLR